MKKYLVSSLFIGSLFGQNIDYQQALKNKPVISVKDFPYAAKGNGTTNDLSAINSAINAANSLSGGGHVIFPAGMYIINAPITLKSNVLLDFMFGASVMNNQAHGSVFTDATSNITNVRITGGKFIASNGSPQAPTASTDGEIFVFAAVDSSIEIDNCDWSSHEFAGIFNLGTIKYLNVHDNHAHDGYNSTDLVNGVVSTDLINSYNTLTYASFRNNVAESYNDYGFILDPNTTSTSTANFNNFENNTIINKQYYGGVFYGQTTSSTQYVQYNKMVGNTFSNIHSRNIASSNGGECVYAVSAQFSEIKDNLCKDAMQGRTGLTLPLGAISLSDSYGSSIIGNTVVNSYYHCYVISNGPPDVANIGTKFEQNKCFTATGLGLLVGGTAYVNSSNNVIQNTQDSGISVDSNSVYFNSSQDTVLSTGLAGNPGIIIAADYTTLTNPHVELSGADGILINSSNVVIESPISKNNGQIGTGYAGLHLNGAHDILVKNGKSFDDQDSATQSVGYYLTGYFGDVVTSCTQANPVSCTCTNAAPATGTYMLSSFGSAFSGTDPNPWQNLNGMKTIVNTGAKTFTVTGVDSSSYGTFAYYPSSAAWSYSNTVRLENNSGKGNVSSLWNLQNLNSFLAPIFAFHNDGMNDSNINTFLGVVGWPNTVGTGGPYALRIGSTLLNYVCDFNMFSGSFAAGGVIQCYDSTSQATKEPLFLNPLGAGADGAVVVFGKKTSNHANYQFHGTVNIDNLPTSCSTQATGTLWNNSGSVGVC